MSETSTFSAGFSGISAEMNSSSAVCSYPPLLFQWRKARAETGGSNATSVTFDTSEKSPGTV